MTSWHLYKAYLFSINIAVFFFFCLYTLLNEFINIINKYQSVRLTYSDLVKRNKTKKFFNQQINPFHEYCNYVDMFWISLSNYSCWNLCCKLCEHCLFKDNSNTFCSICLPTITDPFNLVFLYNTEKHKKIDPLHANLGGFHERSQT